MSWTEMICLLFAASTAGAINAIAGGGTLITFPVLILFGVPPVIANATSTLSLVVGVFGGFLGFRKLIAEIRPWLPAFLPISLLGGWIGSFLLTHGNSETFSKLVPYLILFATLLFMLQGLVRKLVARRAAHQLIAVHDGPPVRGIWLVVAVFFQFLVSIYGGYFGAGIGILMLATFGMLGFSNIHKMNALKNVIGGLINVVAAVWFTFSGLIDWPRMAVMAAGAIAGYYLAATYSQKLPQWMVRYMITAIGLIITVVMFWKLR